MKHALAALYLCTWAALGCESSKDSISSTRVSAESPMRSPFEHQGSRNEPLDSLFDHPLFWLQVKKTQHCHDSGPLSMQSKGRLINVRLELQNKSNKPLYLNPLAFEIQSADEHYRPLLGACGASFSPGYLEPQAQRKGSITFLLPDNLKQPWIMHFRPFIVGSPEVDAQLQLPQASNE